MIGFRSLSFLLLFLPLLADAALSIHPPTRSFGKEGGGAAILTSGSDSWTASTGEDWITITPTTSGSAGDQVVYVVNANLSADPRQGTIAVNGETHTVTQTGYATTLSPASATKDLDGGSFSFEVSTGAGVGWTATADEEWITVETPSGNGPGTVSYQLSPYTGVATRTGSITVGSSTFAVSQTGADVNVSPRTVYKEYSSDVIFVEVSALPSTSWSPVADASWISIVDSGSGSGDSTVAVGLGTNPSNEERSGSVQIGSLSLNITQQGNPNPHPSFSVTPETATADTVEAFGSISVFATPDAPWTAKSLTPWITLQDTGGVGNGNIGYVASANPTLSERTGRVRVYAPYVPPPIDLTTSLQALFWDSSTDYSGWRRHRQGPDGPFTGAFHWTLQGLPIHADQDEGTVFLEFSVQNLGAVHRLFGINAHGKNLGLYVDANNQIVFQANAEKLVGDLVITADQDYDVAVTAASDGTILLYAAVDGSTPVEIGRATFSSAPFPFTSPVAANLVKVGGSDQPNTGNLNGGSLRDFRLYARALRDEDVDALFAASSNQPFGPRPDRTVSPLASYDLRGSAARTRGSPSVAVNEKIELFSTEDTGVNVFLVQQYRFDPDINIPNYEVGYSDYYLSDLKEVFVYDFTPFHLWAGSVLEIEIFSVLKNLIFRRQSLQEVRVQADFELESGEIISQGRPMSHHYSGYPNSHDKAETFTIEFPEERVKTLTISTQAGVLEDHTANEQTRRVTVRLRPLTVDAVERNTGIFGNLQETPGRHAGAQGALQDMEQGWFQLPSHNQLFTNKDASHSFWLRLDEIPAGEQLLFRRSSLNQGKNYSAYLTAEGTLKLYKTGIGSLSQPRETIATIPFPVQTEQWHMLTFTGKKSGAFTVYLDGEEMGNTSAYGDMPFGAIGATNQIPSYFALGGWDGSADQLEFFEEALTSAQVTALYEEQKPTFVDHVVTQGVVTPTLSKETATLAATGGTATTELTLANSVNWTATSSAPWLTLNTATSGAGSATVEVFAAENPSIGSRTATITIAEQTFTVTQEGQPATITNEASVFGTDGGSAFVGIAAGGSATWQSTSNDDWLSVALGQTGSGNGQAMVVAAPYTTTTQSRTGSVTIGDETVFFTQRGYELSIDPQVAQIGSNAGSGQFGVAAPIGAVWEAVATQPWITVVGSTTNIGNGSLSYSVAANDTGQTRTGRILVAGEEYTITQTTALQVTASAGEGGSVSGGGSYDVNDTATLLATAEEGYTFSHWEGDAVGADNPLALGVDSDKMVEAVFIPDEAANTLTANAQQTILADPNSYDLYTADQMRGLAVGKPVLEVDSGTGRLSLRFRVKKSTDLKTWEVMTLDASDMSLIDGQIHLEMDPDGNAVFYQIEAGDLP